MSTAVCFPILENIGEPKSPLGLQKEVETNTLMFF
jgi:hypothetical protein